MSVGLSDMSTRLRSLFADQTGTNINRNLLNIPFKSPLFNQLKPPAPHNILSTAARASEHSSEQPTNPAKSQKPIKKANMA